MKPLKDQATMATLDLTTSLAKGNRALPLLLQAALLFFQESVSQHRQRPEAYKSCGVHQLRVIQAQLFFPILEENLNVPACRDMAEQSGRVGFQIDFWPRSAPRRVAPAASGAR